MKKAPYGEGANGVLEDASLLLELDMYGYGKILASYDSEGYKSVFHSSVANSTCSS